jgi:hypothetical protein
MPKASATTMTTQDEELEAFRKIARAHNNEGRVTFESRDALIRAVAEEQATAMSATERPKNKEPDAGFGQPFRKLPLRLRQRWWQQTNYGERPATNELLWTIEAFSPDAAMHLAAREQGPNLKLVRNKDADNRQGEVK